MLFELIQKNDNSWAYGSLAMGFVEIKREQYNTRTYFLVSMTGKVQKQNKIVTNNLTDAMNSAAKTLRSSYHARQRKLRNV